MVSFIFTLNINVTHQRTEDTNICLRGNFNVMNVKLKEHTVIAIARPIIEMYLLKFSAKQEVTQQPIEE